MVAPARSTRRWSRPPPAGVLELVLLLCAVALFVGWARRLVPDLALTVGVIAAVVLAQASGELENSTFVPG